MRKRSLGKPVINPIRISKIRIRHLFPAQRTAELFQQFNTALINPMEYQTKTFPGVPITMLQLSAVIPIAFTRTINPCLVVQTAIKSGITERLSCLFCGRNATRRRSNAQIRKTGSVFAVFHIIHFLCVSQGAHNGLQCGKVGFEHRQLILWQGDSSQNANDKHNDQ